MELKHKHKHTDDDTIEFIINSPKYGETKVLIDAENKEKVLQYRWCAHKIGKTMYATRNRSISTGGGIFYLHRVIKNTPKNMYTDHINGNGLDNRKSNLRICTRAENARNTKLSIANTTGYKGICLDRRRNTYGASVKGTKGIFLGSYTTKQEAALAYDEGAKEAHGEFANLNFPNGPSEEILKIIEDGRERALEEAGNKYSSKYIGVSKQSNGRFHAVIRSTAAGTYSTEEEAALAYDIGLIKLRGGKENIKNSRSKLNFLNGPSEEILKIIEDGKKRALKKEEERRSRNSSKYIGVLKMKPRSKGNKHIWSARRRFNGEMKYFNSYLTEEEAAIACDREIIRLHNGIIDPDYNINFPERLEEYLAEIEKGEIKIKRNPSKGRRKTTGEKNEEKRR